MGPWRAVILAGVLLSPARAGLAHEAAPGGDAAAATPAIAIIIDDLGYHRYAGLRSVALPGRITVAILPHTPHARELAEAARAAGKQVMLHLPMQAAEMQRALGPGGVNLDMNQAEFDRSLEASLDSVPHVQGVNNHMGSLLTMHPGHMGWLMHALRRRGLFFVDSYTTHKSVALQLAREAGVPATRRDVFLDRSQDTGSIAAEWERLKARARRDGAALGIGHPFPGTLELLAQRLPELTREGYRLVFASELTSLDNGGD